MKKKYLTMMLAVGVSAGMMLAGCGKSDEAPVETSVEASVETSVEASAEVPVEASAEVETTQETQTETVEQNDAAAGEDFLAANHIQIDTLPTLELLADDGACRAIFEGYMGMEEDDGSFALQYAEIDAASNQTIVKLYHDMGISKEHVSDDYSYIVDFYDRYTGENILKTSDIHGTFAEGSKVLEARDGFEVEVSFSPYEEFQGRYWNIATYTITYADGYDGLVVHVGGYDFPSVRAEHEALNKDTYTLLDRPALFQGSFKRSYIYTATNN